MSSENVVRTAIKPTHYCDNAVNIEPIEVARYLNFDLGNVWKYCARYLYKHTPGTDLGKAIFYLTDFRKNWVDEMNECTYVHHVPQEIVDIMIKFIDAETRPEVKNVFTVVLEIVTENCIRDIKEFDLARYELLQYAKTFSDADLKDLEWGDYAYNI